MSRGAFAAARLDNARGVLAGIEAKVAYTSEAMAAAERAKADMETSLENERKSLRTANELAAQQVGRGSKNRAWARHAREGGWMWFGG